MYPLAKDCISGVRDPCWLNLPSVQSIGLCVQSLPHVASNCKNKLCIIALALEVRSSLHNEESVIKLLIYEAEYVISLCRNCDIIIVVIIIIIVITVAIVIILIRYCDTKSCESTQTRSIRLTNLPETLISLQTCYRRKFFIQISIVAPSCSSPIHQE